MLVQGTTGTKFINIDGSTTDPVPVTIKNEDGSITIYIGGSDVSSTKGQSLVAGGSISYNLYGSSEIPYAIAASATPVVSVLCGRQ